MWTHPGIDVFDELDSRAGLQPAHLIKWNPFLDKAAAVHELESCEDLVIGVLDHFLENEPSPNLDASTSLPRPLPSFHRGETVTIGLAEHPYEHSPEHQVLLAVDRPILATHRDRARRLEASRPMGQAG
jgi:hypothetical protein